MRQTKAQKEQKAKALGALLSYMSARSLADRYDALKPDPLRRQAELHSELTETEQVFKADRRLKSYALADDLYDNDQVGAILDTSVRLAVGSRGGTPVFLGDGADYCQAVFRCWKSSCGFAEGECWSDMLQLILRLVKLHGDCLVVIDPVLTGGRLRVWDADQITSVNDFDQWKRENGRPDGWRQVEGVVLDDQGRVQGWFVTARRSCYSVSLREATFIPADLGRRVSYHRKHTQYRGESILLPNMDLCDDTRSLIKSEVAAAKLAAEMPLVYQAAPGTDTGALNGILEGLTAGDLGISDDDIAAVAKTADTSRIFKAFEGKAAIAQIASGASMSNLAGAARPGQPVQQWLDRNADMAGQRMGVMSCLARGRADNSYSSGQIELSISWTSFEEDQKLLERQVVDYAVSRLLPSAEYVVTWPQAFDIDPEKSARVQEQRLRAGLSTYRDVLGPDWQDQLRQVAEERAFATSLGLQTLPTQTTGAGNAIEAAPEQQQEEAANG